MERGRLSILSCESGKEFANRIVKHLNHHLKQNRKTETSVRQTLEVFFANKEVKSVIKENIRGDDVYIVQCMDDPLCRSERSLNDNFMALMTIIDAARNSDAESVTAVIPQYPYARQERKKGRESITARQIATFLEVAGADRVITLDIHAEAVEGFFRKGTLENLHASRAIIEHVQKKYAIPDLTIVAPDVGSAEKARFYSQEMKTTFAVVDKVRDYSQASVIEAVNLIGSVENRNVLMTDDMIATGGTLVSAARLLKENGAKDIYFVCSLPYMNGSAVNKLEAAYKEGIIKRIIGTDAVFHGEEFVAKHEWYEEVSIAPLFAQVIYNINNKLSVSELLK